MKNVIGLATAFFDRFLEDGRMRFLKPHLVGNNQLIEKVKQVELRKGRLQAPIPIGKNSETYPFAPQDLEHRTNPGIQRPGRGSDEIFIEILKNPPDVLSGNRLAKGMRNDLEPFISQDLIGAGKLSLPGAPPGSFPGLEKPLIEQI